MGSVIVMLFTILILRLFDLQIVNKDYYMDSYIQQAEKTIYTAGTRGKIYDCNGEVLAYNELTYAVTIEDKIESSEEKGEIFNAIVYNAIRIIEEHGDEISVDFPIIINKDGNFEFSFTSDSAKNLFFKNLFGDNLEVNNHDYTNASAAEVIEYLRDEKFEVSTEYDDEMLLKILTIRYNVFLNSYQKYVTTTIATEVSDETMAAIYENEAILTGVTVAETNVRKYVNSEYFAPIIGYTGKISEEQLAQYQEEGKDYISTDYVGKAGIEAAMEEELQGTRGEEKIFVDSLGKTLSTSSKTEAQAGNDVYLTIDKKLQVAAYKTLEKRIASILISEIVNRDVSEDEENDDDIHYIPVKNVYFQLVNNNIVSIERLAKKKTSNEERVYKKYTGSLKTVVSKITNQLQGDGVEYKDLSEEYKDYYDYIYDELIADNILISSSIDTKDETYKKYINEKISLNEFLMYAISKSWVNVTALDIDDSYITTDDTYNILCEYIINFLESNTSFAKRIFYFRINDGTIHGSEVCMLLYDQKVLDMNEKWYNKLLAYDSVYTYKFIIEQIKKLNITPAQIALDPCSGSVVVTNPNNGDVLALVTYPSYDNNMLSGSVDATYWAKLIDDDSDPLYNRATQGASAPGSTFKMVSAMAALEENVVSRYETILDEGKFEKIKPSPKCWIYPSAHGKVNVMEALAESCNGYFYEIGYRLGTNSKDNYDSALGLSKLETYATELGLNMLSGVEITEREPHFSTESAIHSAIGQGSNSYTPVQLARYVSTVANGGNNYELTLIDKITDNAGKLKKDNEAELTNSVEASQDTWDAIHQGMREVITEGTVQKYFKDTKIKFAGKSGTAEENSKRNAHAFFVAYAPYNEPEIAISTSIPYGNSSHDAAELAKDVGKYYFGELKDKDINAEVKVQSERKATLD